MFGNKEKAVQPEFWVAAQQLPKSPKSSFYSKLDRTNAATLPCGLKSRPDADAALAGITVKQETVQYCVTSSGGADEGCFLSQADALAEALREGVAGITCPRGEVDSLDGPTDPSLRITQALV